jgi:hypothetical protein
VRLDPGVDAGHVVEGATLTSGNLGIYGLHKG